MGTTRSGAQRLFTTMRGTGLAAVIGLSLLLVLATSASALSGSTIDIGEFAHNGPPSIAVDGAGNALIAWADEAGPPYKIHYCVLPVGATACAHSGELTPAGGTEPYIDGVKVLADGGTLVVLADVYGVSQEYEPEQEWTSTDGGATFAIADGGKSVAEANLSADTEPVGAVILPGTSVLGYAWVTAAGPPTFAAFPLSSPAQCSEKTGHTCPFATLQPESSEHLLSNPGAAVASQLGANPGVLGVYETLGKPGCSSGTFDSAFAYGSGNQSASNSYNVSPGEPNSAWKVPLSPGDCEVEYLAVGGGPSGFGVIEDDLTRNFTVYHRFDQATDTFDTPYATVAQEGEQSASLSQDASGGVYTTYLARFDEVRLAYSSDGGTTWSGPATLNAAGDSDLASNVNAGGQGWATWIKGETLYAQPFVASDSVPVLPPAPTALTTTQTSGSTQGASITVPAGTIGETDSATISGANAATATGTVAYGLYTSSSCTPTSKVFGSANAVSGGKVAASAAVTSALAQGTYYWQTAYSGDAHNDPSTSACGSEVLTIGPPGTISSAGSSSGTTITLTITCAVVPCTVTVTITITETSGKAAAARKKKSKRRTRTVTLATGKFTILSTSPKKLTVHLTKAGRLYLAKHHGRASAKVLVSDKTTSATELTSRTIRITPAKHKHKK